MKLRNFRFTIDTLTYLVSEDTCHVYPASKNIRGDITISSPVVYDGETYWVREIKEWAFEGCFNLTSVTIGDSVTEIGRHAFGNCGDLTSVTIGNSVTVIRQGAFWDCRNLTSLTIGRSVTEIEKFLVFGCLKLRDVTVFWDRPLPISDDVFIYQHGLMIHVPPGTEDLYRDDPAWGCLGEVTSQGEYNQPYRIIKPLQKNLVEPDVFLSPIDALTFSVSGGVCSVSTKSCGISGDLTIPSAGTYNGETYKVTEIGKRAFSGCRNLTSVTIPDTVTAIGEWAFSGCRKLISITIPDTVTEIGFAAFPNCHSLRFVTIPDRVTKIGDWTFSDCQSLISVTIPELVTVIGTGAFVRCYSLTSVTIGNSVTKIGESAFRFCRELRDVTVFWDTPLPIDESIFKDRFLAKPTLHVPPGTEALYRAAPVWNNFKEITSVPQ